MRSGPKGFLAVIGVLLLSACGGDNSTGISGDASGSYNLTTVDGTAVPFTYFSDDTTTARVTGGNFTLNEDGSFSQTLNFDATISGQTSIDAITCQGNYTHSGGTYTFAEVAAGDVSCGSTYNGSWNGSNTFLFSLGGHAFVYVKP
jgi:hypothetical protein